MCLHRDGRDVVPNPSAAKGLGGQRESKYDIIVIILIGASLILGAEVMR